MGSRALASLLSLLAACSASETVVPFPELGGARSVLIAAEAPSRLDVFSHRADQVPVPLRLDAVPRVQVWLYDDLELEDLELPAGKLEPASADEAGRALFEPSRVLEWTEDAPTAWRESVPSAAMRNFRTPVAAPTCVGVRDLQLFELFSPEFRSTQNSVSIDDRRALILNNGFLYLFDVETQELTEVTVEPDIWRPHRLRKRADGALFGAAGASLFGVTLDVDAAHLDVVVVDTATASAPGGFGDIAFADDGTLYAGSNEGQLLRLDENGLVPVDRVDWPGNAGLFFGTSSLGRVMFATVRSTRMLFASRTRVDREDAPGLTAPSAFGRVEGLGDVLTNVEAELYARSDGDWRPLGVVPTKLEVSSIVPLGEKRFLMGGNAGTIVLYDDGALCTLSAQLGLHVRHVGRVGDWFIATGSRASGGQVAAFSVFRLEE